VAAVLGIGAVVYLAAFWNGNGTLAQPARAVHAAVAPDARDRSSNEYRVEENLNLQVGIRARRSVGEGFGVPIAGGFGIANLTSADSMINFIPHDGVLYVWYRLGILGEFLLWSVIGFAIVAGCELVKNRDRMTAAFGSIAVCAIVSYVLQGYNDLGFDWTRIVVFMGFVLGALEATMKRHSGVVSPAPRGHGSLLPLSPAGSEPPSYTAVRPFAISARALHG